MKMHDSEYSTIKPVKVDDNPCPSLVVAICIHTARLLKCIFNTCMCETKKKKKVYMKSMQCTPLLLHLFAQTY